MKNKKWIGLIVAVLLGILAIPVAGFASNQTASTEEELNNAIAAAGAGDKIILTGDIDLNATVEVGAGKEIILDLNGHVLNGSNITKATEIDQSASVIRNNGTLTIEDNANGVSQHYFKVVKDNPWSLLQNPTEDEIGIATSFEDLSSRCNDGDVIIITCGVITGGKGTVTSKTQTSTSTSGGAIYCSADTNLTLNSGAIVGNLALYGCGINSNYGNVIINGGTIAGNGNIYAGGGGISCSKSLQITGGTISQNTAQRSGGIDLYNSIGSYTINGGTISYNYSQGSGGGIAIHSQTNLKIINGTITGNIAKGAGGGVCIEDNSSTFLKVGGTAKIVGNTLSDSTPSNVHLKNSTYKGKIQIDSDSNALSSGASIGIARDTPGVFAEGAKTEDEQYFFSDDPSKRIVAGTLSGTLEKVSYSHTINNDTAMSHGSIVYNNGNALATGGDNGDIITVIANPDDGYELGEITAWETGNPTNVLSVDQQNATFTMPDFAVTVSANFIDSSTVEFEVYREGSEQDDVEGTLKYALEHIKKGNIIKLMADIDLSATIKVDTEKDFVLDLNGCILNAGNIPKPTQTEDINGTASVLRNSGTIKIIDSRPTEKHQGTELPDGGIITGGQGDRAGTSVPCYYGGAIYNDKDGSLILEGGTITKNSAIYGGAIYSIGIVTLKGATIAENSASYGGGVALVYGKMTMEGGMISNNTSSTGGGISRSDSNVDPQKYTKLIITGGTISNNTAEWGCGGLDCGNSRGTVTITGGEIFGNHAKYYAGVGVNAGGGNNYSNSTVNIGGDVKIHDNTITDTTTLSNVDVNYFKLTISSETPLKNGAAIGVSKMNKTTSSFEAGVFATNTTEADKAFFTSDDTNKRIVYNDGKLELVDYSYAIIKDDSITHGTIEGFKKGNNFVGGGEEGDTIKVITQADEDYELDTITVWKTGTPSQKVTVNADGTFTMPDYDVTVSATFKGKSYPITTVTDGKGTVSVTKDGKKVTEGEYNATHTVNVEPDFKFYKVESIIVYKTGDSTKENILQNDYTFTMPNEGVTINATFYETEMPCPIHRFFRKVKIFFKNLFK